MMSKTQIAATFAIAAMTAGMVSMPAVAKPKAGPITTVATASSNSEEAKEAAPGQCVSEIAKEKQGPFTTDVKDLCDAGPVSK